MPEIWPFFFFLIFGLPLPLGALTILIIDLGTDVVNVLTYSVILLLLIGLFSTPYHFGCFVNKPKTVRLRVARCARGTFSMLFQITGNL